MKRKLVPITWDMIREWTDPATGYSDLRSNPTPYGQRVVFGYSNGSVVIALYRGPTLDRWAVNACVDGGTYLPTCPDWLSGSDLVDLSIAECPIPGAIVMAPPEFSLDEIELAEKMVS